MIASLCNEPGPLFVVAGGGTGGHLYPALAVADSIRARVPSARFVFFGTQRRIDDRILARTDSTLVKQDLEPLSANPWRWPRIILGYRGAVQRCREFFHSSPPAAVIATGGLASVPPARAALRMGIPIFILNPDAKPGKANRFLARSASAVFTQWEDSAAYLPRQTRLEVLGCAVRPEFRHVDFGRAHATFRLDPARKTLLVTGASQGAKSINDALVALLDMLATDEWHDWQVLHLSGEADFARVHAAYAGHNVHATVAAYTDDMALALAAADLVVSRSGASTLAELTAVGRASILMPYPYHRDQHQLINAECLQRASAAQIVLDARSAAPNASALRAALIPLMVDDERRILMADAAKRIGKPNAADAIAERVLSILPA